MQVDLDVPGWLASQKHSIPKHLINDFNQFESLYDKKLWHQLTIKLQDFISKPDTDNLLIPLYSNFVKDWEKKMNKISLVRFATKTSRQFKSHKEALEFLAPFVSQLTNVENAKDAFVLIKMETAHYQLLSGDSEGCKNAMAECEAILEKLPGIDPVINASFYRVAADYFKATMAYPKYYHNALLYLSSVALEDLTVSEQQERAFELSMSALLGEGLYNFGELLIHPILNSLQGTPYSWLRDLLLFYNSGNIEGFEKMSKSGDFLKQPLLVSALAFLRQKLCLMTLVEAVFKRSKEQRGHMTFNEVSKETRVPLDEVEHLVMKALSLELIKGSIDEVEGIVQVTWVQPRVLDKTQIKHIADRIDEWGVKVKEQVLGLEREDAFKTVFIQ
ncbi:hypothetical protein BC833DRAFT_528164 [Globomyces pollinis-pini]|nr:hypothetical protein BC833DRAFT_528164 [Globomyces pollinis-pini]